MKGLDGKLYKKKKKTLTSPLPYNKTLCTKVIFKVISLQIYNISLSSANIFRKINLHAPYWNHNLHLTTSVSPPVAVSCLAIRTQKTPSSCSWR